MAALCRLAPKLGRQFLFFPNRSIFVSATTQLKKIVETKEGNSTIIEGVIYQDEKESRLLKPAENGACPLCSTNLDVKHTDVLILSQFLRSDGCLLPRRITGLCNVQQKRVSKLVAMAQKAGLMPNLAPENSRKDPHRRFRWKKFNTYYDEKTIKARYM